MTYCDGGGIDGDVRAGTAPRWPPCLASSSSVGHSVGASEEATEAAEPLPLGSLDEGRLVSSGGRLSRSTRKMMPSGFVGASSATRSPWRTGAEPPFPTSSPLRKVPNRERSSSNSCPVVRKKTQCCPETRPCVITVLHAFERPSMCAAPRITDCPGAFSAGPGSSSTSMPHAAFAAASPSLAPPAAEVEPPSPTGMRALWFGGGGSEGPPPAAPPSIARIALIGSVAAPLTEHPPPPDARDEPPPALPAPPPPTYCETASVGRGAGHIDDRVSSLGPCDAGESSDPPDREVIERLPSNSPLSRSAKLFGADEWPECVE